MHARGKKFPGFSWVIGGEAGYGINVSAEIFGRALFKSGYYVFGYIEYESRIRGGHIFARIRFSNEPVYCHVDDTDVLLALDDMTIVGDKHGIHTHGHVTELHRNSILIYDGELSNIAKGYFEELSNKGIRIIDIPLMSIVKETTRQEKPNLVMRNTVGLGASAYILNLDTEKLIEAIKWRLGEKRKEIVEANINLILAGYDYVKSSYPNVKLNIKPGSVNGRIYVNGNFMAMTGSIKAGMKIWAHYPMTPSTPLLNLANRFKKKYGLVVLQPESELAVINIAIGAGYAGVRAGVGTSGGGFALMTEAISLASMAEIPVVVFEVSRVAPSTGMATKTEQGDLLQVVYAGQGYTTKAVILPGDPEEAYYDAIIAYNVAEKYQIPVIVCYDKHLAESYYTIPIPESNIPIERGKITLSNNSDGPYFKRYAITEDGVSPRPILGTEGVFVLSTGLEHDEYGVVTENERIRTEMMKKRDRKLRSLLMEIEERKEIYRPIMIYGEEDSSVAVVGWGSSKGVLLEATEYLNKKGYDIKFVQIRWAMPFPTDTFLDAVNDVDRIIMVEANFDGQMEKIIRYETCMCIDHRIRKYDGRPFSLNEIVSKLEVILA